MAEHCFMACWNYCQYKRARINLKQGAVIVVQDFAQNYLCKHHDKPQAIHWVHQQVTLYPSVEHHVCTKLQCQQLVTHKVVHVSNDLKHDAILVQKFQQKTLQVLQQNGVLIHKIIEFMDQTPSQYKSKNAFQYLTQNTA